MRSDDVQSTTAVEQRLFSRLQSERLKAVPQVRNLKSTDAFRLLRKALTHWDRRLVSSCATLLAEMFTARATSDIIKIIDSTSINHSLAIRLLVQCGTPQAALKIWSRRFDSRNAVVDLAWEGLGKLNSCKAVLAICKSHGRWDPDLERYLSLFKSKLVTEVFRSLGAKSHRDLLTSIASRGYFRKRKLEQAIFPKDDDERWLRRALSQGATLEDIGARFLDTISSDALRDCLEHLPKELRLAYLKHRPTAAYLDQRGIRLAEAEQTSPKRKSNFVSDLATVIKVDSSELGLLCDRWKKLDGDYHRSRIRKRRGGYREILAPAPLLKSVQRAINAEILTKAELHPACHGFRKKHSIVSNAVPHTGQEIVINIDLKDFFPSISAARVYGVYKSLGHPVDEARYLTRLSTYKEHLPQGAPTSPMLANLVCRRLDSRLAGLAKKHGANYTRYADDLTFSGPRRIVGTMPFIRQVIAEEGLTISEEKVRLTGRGNRQEVTGLVVNQAVNVPRETRRRLRAALHHLTQGKPITWNHEEVSVSNLQGHVAFVKSVQPDLGRKLRRKLKKFLPKKSPEPLVPTTPPPTAPSAVTAAKTPRAPRVDGELLVPRTGQIESAPFTLPDLPPPLPDLTCAILTGNAKAALRLCEDAVAKSIDSAFIKQSLRLGITEVMNRFARNEYFVPEVLISATAMTVALECLHNARASSRLPPEIRTVLGCVHGNTMDIGKNLVASLWNLNDFEVTDLGVDVSPEVFLNAAQIQSPDVVGLSVGLSTTIENAETTIKVLRAAGISTRVIVGGAAMTELIADQVGADGYASDCCTAVEVARRLFGMPFESGSQP